MVLKYQILFAIELLSDYYLNEKARHLVIEPTDDTARFLQDQQILFRQLGNKLILIAKTDDAGKPFIPIHAAASFRFYLRVDHHSFFQYSDLIYDPSTDQRYYFSNQVVNVVTNPNPLYNKVYISKKLDAVYSSFANYLPGDLVINNPVDKEIFEAIRKSNNKPLSDTAYWYKRTTVGTPRQYISRSDLQMMRENNYNFHLASATTKAIIQVNRFNITTGMYDIPADFVSREFAPATQDILVDLSLLKAGRYRIDISYGNTNESREMHVDPVLFDGGIIGVIEISNNLSDASPYSFIDAMGKIKVPETKFSLRFANRLAYWKYIAQTDSVQNVKERTNIYSFAPDGSLKFRSATPIAFHEKPYDILIDYKHDSGSPNVEIEGMKNASYQYVKKTPVGPDETFDCAEIYLNY